MIVVKRMFSPIKAIYKGLYMIR